MSGVSSEKGKSFRKRNKCGFFQGGGKAKILQKKYGREIINYDKIKLLMLTSESRKVFSAINWCSYGFRVIYFFVIFFCEISHRLRIFCFIHFCEISQKILRNTNENFRDFFAKVFVCWKPQACLIKNTEGIHHKNYWRKLSELSPFKAGRTMISHALMIRQRMKGYRCESEMFFFQWKVI